MKKLLTIVLICTLFGISDVNAEDIFFDNPMTPNTEGRIEIGGAYSKDNEHVYYYDANESVVEGADPATFEVIDFYTGMDKNGIYREEKYVEGVDIDSFQLLNFMYAKDKNAIYYIFNTFSSLASADAPTFKVDKNNMFATDKNHVFYHDEIVIGADPKTFEVITSHYFKDKNGVYYGHDYTPVLIESSDVESFEIIGERLSKDRNHVYCDHNIASIEEMFNNFNYSDNNGVYYGYGCPQFFTEIDKNSLEFVNDRIVKDKNGIYVGGQTLDQIDFGSLVVLNEKYIKDESSIYNITDYPPPPKSVDDPPSPPIQTIEGIYPYDFDYLGGDIYRDHSYIYEENNGEFYILEGVDKDTFELLNDLYAKDKNHVYDIEYGIEIKNGADPDTFVVIDGDYSKDKNSVYKWSELALADPETFEIIDGTYSKDSRRVYINSVMIKYADPETFEVIGMGLSKDKRFVYTWESVLEGAGTEIELINGDQDTWYTYAKDSNYVYFINYRGRAERIDWVDVDTFEIIDLGYKFKDKNGLYINESSDSGFDFEVEECYSGNCNMAYTLSFGSALLGDKSIDDFDKVNDFYIKDDHNAYYLPYGSEYEVEPVFDIDSSTFEVLSNYYTKDAYHVFYRWFSIPDADPKTFEMLGENIAKDKNHAYYYGDIVTGIDVETLESAVGNTEWNYDDEVKDKNGSYKWARGKLVNVENDNSYQEIKKKPLNGGFSDVAGNEYKSSIENLAYLNIVSGYDDNTFRPDQAVNRAEALKMILTSIDPYGLYSVPDHDFNMFSDLDSDSWYAGYVDYALDKQIINGYPDGTFKGNNHVNLAEALKMIFGAYEVDIYQNNDTPWHETYLDAVSRIGIGIYDSDFHGFNNPNQLLTRAELTYLIDSFMKKADMGVFDNEEWRKKPRSVFTLGI